MPIALPAAFATVGTAAADTAWASALAGTGTFAAADAAAMSVGTVGAAASAIAGTVGTAAKWLNIGGNIVSGIGQYEQGKTNQAIEEAKATQEKNAANAEAAAGEQQMAVERRNTQLAMSKVQADAAASGGGLDPSVVNLLGNLQVEGKQNEYNVLYNAQTKQTSDLNQSAMDRFQAGQDATAGEIGAVSSIFKAGTQSLYDKYNGGL